MDDDSDREQRVTMSREEFIHSLKMASRLPEAEIDEWANLGRPVVFEYDPPFGTPAPAGRNVADVRPETAAERQQRKNRPGLTPAQFFIQLEVVEAYKRVRKRRSREKEPSVRRGILMEAVRAVRGIIPDNLDEEDLDYITETIDRLFLPNHLR